MELVILSLFASLFAPTLADSGAAAFDIFNRVQRGSSAETEVFEKRAAPTLPKRQSSSFLNNATQKFVVDGTALPDVNFDIGESYAGLLPISQAANETRKLYFWFFPTTDPAGSQDVTIWLNGGPGCSSLSGLLQENGPFLWQAGTLAPTPNPYAWRNLTNMLYIEQPVGVGFTQGTPNITDEVQLGQEFIGFYKNFVNAFQTQGYKTFVTGESYAGYYVPYIADAFIMANDTDYYNLAGISINDPIIGDDYLQQEVIVPAYTDYWANLFYFNESTNTQLHATADACGYTDYYKTYMTFPPPGTFPDVPSQNNDSCDVQGIAYGAVLDVNPCFNIYHITDTCPFPYSILGIINTGDYEPPGGVVYFNRSDVQAAINAPVGTDWATCKSGVFGRGGDQSYGPAQDGVLQHVIEYTNNAMIGSGNLDFLLPTNGTLLAIQNMTWNGLQGFQQDPRSANEFYVPFHTESNGGAQTGAGDIGNWGTERGLTFYTVQLAGHELPGYSLGGGFRMLEYLLGRIENLSSDVPFGTTGGNASVAAESVGRRANVMRGLRMPRAF